MHGGDAEVGWPQGRAGLGSGVELRSPTFLAPGIGLVGDSYSTEGEGGGVEGVGDGSGGNASDGERR